MPFRFGPLFARPTGAAPPGPSGTNGRRLTSQRGGGGTASPCAAGLAAAWHYARHTTFRLLTIYCSPLPRLSSIDSRAVSTGENVWFLEPQDEGVFLGANDNHQWEQSPGEGIVYVSPVQAYLDLKYHPERSTEAAEALLKKALTFEADTHDG